MAVRCYAGSYQTQVFQGRNAAAVHAAAARWLEAGNVTPISVVPLVADDGSAELLVVYA